MKQSLHIIDSRTDAASGWKRPGNFAFSAKDTVALLLLSELHLALPFYPLAFVRRSDGKGFMLVALLGIHSGENLYVTEQGGWKVSFIPGIYRSYPFFMQQVAGKDGALRGVVAIDRDSGLYLENPSGNQDEERFFDDQRKPTPFMKELMTFLQESTVNRLLTEKAVNALDAASLLKPWTLDIENPDSERPLLRGLHCIDRKAFYAMDQKNLKHLHDSGGMAIAYAQLFSMPRINVLRKLYNLKYATSTQPDKTEQLKSIHALFGGDLKDEIKFDWSKI